MGVEKGLAGSIHHSTKQPLTARWRLQSKLYEQHIFVFRILLHVHRLINHLQTCFIMIRQLYTHVSSINICVVVCFLINIFVFVCLFISLSMFVFPCFLCYRMFKLLFVFYKFTIFHKLLKLHDLLKSFPGVFLYF